MAPRSPNEADTYLNEAAELGQVNDTQLRRLQGEVEADRSRGRARAARVAESAYADSQRFGAPALEEFNAVVAEATALADAVSIGDIDLDAARRQHQALLARHADAERRRTDFESAADRIVVIEDDPDAWNEDFLRRYPDARTEFEW